MKKYKYFLVTLIIIMTIPIIYHLSIKHHEKKYNIDSYEIIETFNIIDKKHFYDFIIKNGKEVYSYTIEKNIHKKNKIIKDLKVYKENDIKCILPMYKRGKEKELFCIKNGVQVTEEVLKNNKDYKAIASKAKVTISKENNTKTEFENLTIYSNNIPKDNALIIWNYKGIYILKNGKNLYQPFLKNDLYDNIMATTVSKYFVLFENISVNGIEKIHYYDIEKEKYKIWKLNEKISKNSYINGVQDDLIYVTDMEKKKQYTINIRKKKIEEVGNEENKYIKYVNGKKELLEKSDFLIKEQYFQNVPITNKKISKSKDIRIESNYSYFQEEGCFYKQMDKANKVLLFEMDEVGEWIVQDRDILLRKEKMLYLYNDHTGLKKLLEYNELKYNNKNIYYLWK